MIRWQPLIPFAIEGQSGNDLRARPRLLSWVDRRGIMIQGHDLLYVAEVASGATDAQVLRRARKDSRLLLTEDKDFGELLFRLKLAARGLVLLRLRPEEHLLEWARLEAAVGQFVDKLLGRYLVIEETRFRSRPLLRSVR